ncbi:MAG: thiolase family protein [Infirmifilum sp.]
MEKTGIIGQVGVVGAYSTKYESRTSKDTSELIREVAVNVFNTVDKGISPGEVDLIITSNYSDSFGILLHSAPLVADIIGNRSAVGFRVENACASGTTAVYLAWQLLSTGKFRNALIVGFEKMSSQGSSAKANELLMRTGSPDEYRTGAPFLSLYALIAREYMRKYGATEEDLALVAVKNHENATRNPLAQFQKKITVDDVLRSPYISTPLKLLDASPLSDGAVALLLSSDPKKYTDSPVYLKGISLKHDYPGVYQREDMSSFKAVREASEEAYRMSGLGPEKIDLFEVHDAFTISEIILYEMLGLAEKGKGYKLLREGVTSFAGHKPVNASGGLKAKGHPIGATGVGMVAEVYWQLRGEAGARQVSGAEAGLVENHGGTGGTSVVIVLTR